MIAEPTCTRSMVMTSVVRAPIKQRWAHTLSRYPEVNPNCKFLGSLMENHTGTVSGDDGFVL